MKRKEPQQELPFVLEGNTATRTTVRSIAKTADGLHKISISLIRIRPQFNARRKPEGMHEEMWNHILMIPDLADAIYASNGPAEPILGDFYKGNECFYITNGERRYRALKHLIATERETYPNGNLVDEVYVLLNPNGTTDLDRKRKVIATQDNLKLKPMEKAYYYQSFAVENGMTHDDIAKFLQVSRQTVDNYILATELDPITQEKVDNDEVKLTNALSDLRNKKKAVKGKKSAIIDLETGEITEDKDENLRGDENEFEQQDNSKDGPSSLHGPKEEGSGAHTIGKDSIYMDQQKLALWKQFINRYGVVKDDILIDKGNFLKWEDMLAERLKNEYNLTVK